MERPKKAKRLMEQVRVAKDAGNTELAAEAIREIRDKDIWREAGFKSFGDYAKNASPYSANYTYKLSVNPLLAPASPAIKAFTDHVIETGRELKDQQRQHIIDTLPPVRGDETGKKMQIFDDPELAPAKPTVATAKAVEKIFEDLAIPIKDLRGNVLSKKMAELFENAGRHFAGLYANIHDMRQTLRDLAAEKSGASFSVHNRMQVIMQHLHSVEGIVNDCRPYSVCIFCSGNRRKCAACGGAGFLSEQQYIDATTKR